MTKNSNFKGMASTKEAGEDFIAEKASFLVYLAHSHRLEEKYGKLSVGGSKNLIGKVFGEKADDVDAVKDEEYDFNQNEKASSESASRFAIGLDSLIDTRSNPKRILRFLH
jgi:hypothetical protein